MGMRSQLGIFLRYKPMSVGSGREIKGHIETMVRCHIFYLKKYVL